MQMAPGPLPEVESAIREFSHLGKLSIYPGLSVGTVGTNMGIDYCFVVFLIDELDCSR